MKQRKTIIFLGIIILISICIGGIAFTLLLQRQNDKYIKTANEDDISRYEWMEMLCEQNGLTEYQNKEPYYEDVDTGNAYFPYIQSAVEWDVLVNDTKFEGEGYASGRFIALTAMKTIGERKLGFYLDTEDAITDDIYIELAIEHELIEEKQLTEGFAIEECEQVLESLKNLYFSEFWRDDYSNITYQDGVIELSSDDVLQSSMDGSEIVVADDVRNTLKTGTVIVFEQENTKLKFAREIAGIDADGTLSLNPVELDRVVESLTVSDITELTFEDIVNYYEVEENTYAVNNLERQQTDEKFINTEIFPIDKNSKGFKISLSTEGEGDDNHLEIQVTNNATGVAKKLPINYKVEQGSEYSAEINIEKILIGGQVDYKVLGGVRYADVAVDVESTFEGTIKAEEEKKIPLLKTPASLGNGFAGVNIQFYLVLSMEGGISFEAELPVEVSLYYEKDKGFRNFRHDISPRNLEVEANCEAEAKFRIEPTVFILYCLDIVDMEVDIGVEASAEITTRPDSQVCADISVSFPVITILVCGDDDANTYIGNKGWSAEWKIFSADKEEDGALFQSPLQLELHFERLPDKTVQFVKECTYKEERKEVDAYKVDREEVDIYQEDREEVDDKPVTKGNMQMNNTYYTRYKEITGIDNPVFSFDYSDDWSVSMEKINATEYGMFGEYAKEVVELTNERGVTVTFIKIDGEIFDIAGRNHFYSSYSIEKIADADFAMLDGSVSDNFIVVKLTDDGTIITGIGDWDEGGNIFYTIMQESIVEELGYSLSTAGPLGFEEKISFDYPTPYVFYAKAPNGQFTEEEEKEVIAILSSFREVQ